MKFMGSKARIAKYIVPILQKQLNEGDCCAYIEPFVGGANVIEHIKHSHKLGLDCSVPLIELLKYATQGGQLPDQISVDEYKKVKESPWNYPLWFVGATGYLTTYNGKYFGGYAGCVHTKIGTTRNYYDEAKRNLERQVPYLQDVVFKHTDYAYMELPLQKCLIYADPPYNRTTGYGTKFNSTKFWETVRHWSQKHTVITSEHNAPSDFSVIWEMPITRTMNNGSRSTATEKLFIYDGGTDTC